MKWVSVRALGVFEAAKLQKHRDESDGNSGVGWKGHNKIKNGGKDFI